MNCSDLLPLAAAAQQFGVSERLLHQLAHNGKLSRFKFGRRTLLDRRQLESLIHQEGRANRVVIKTGDPFDNAVSVTPRRREAQ